MQTAQNRRGGVLDRTHGLFHLQHQSRAGDRDPVARNGEWRPSIFPRPCKASWPSVWSRPSVRNARKEAPSDEEWDYLVNHYGPESFPELGIERASARLHWAIGCPRCARTGYKGRTGIHELLVATPDVRRAIVRRQPAEEIALLGHGSGHADPASGWNL